jgi:O-acetyl-ADP-ribose deacetylase (regulator of RNase III)
MLEIIKGNLLRAAREGEVYILAHQCNCHCAMGAGFAERLAKVFPEAEAVDKATVRGDQSKLGTFTKVTVRGTTIYNLYGQFGFWKPKPGEQNTDLPALSQALQAMAQDVGDTPGVIGMPKIGSVLGAVGIWDEVAKLIELAFPNRTIRIYVE